MDCHADQENTVRQFRVTHDPVEKMNCVACHQAHGSELESHLKSEQPGLCLICHGEITQYWQDGVAHEPAKESCTECHNGHGSSNDSILIMAKDELCVNCHDIVETDFIKTHKGIKPSTGSCLGCHDPHGAPAKGLLYPLVHSPFGEGNCKPCHQGVAK
jgi:predicted CXXCH cytochrome family protein